MCIDVIGNTDIHYEKNEMGGACNTYSGENRSSVLVEKTA
jgi:hypothetical protein